MKKILMNYNRPLNYYEYDLKSVLEISNKEFIDMEYDGVGAYLGEDFIGFFVDEEQLYVIHNNKITLVKDANIKCFNQEISKNRYNLKVYDNEKLFIDSNYNYYYDLDLDTYEFDDSLGDLFVKYLNSLEGIENLINRYKKKETIIKKAM